MLYKPCAINNGFQGGFTLLACAKVLGMIHLHEDKFQVLGRHILIGNEEANPVIWSLVYGTTSRMAELGVMQAVCWEMQTQNKEGRVLTLLISGQNFQGLNISQTQFCSGVVASLIPRVSSPTTSLFHTIIFMYPFLVLIFYSRWLSLKKIPCFFKFFISISSLLWGI